MRYGYHDLGEQPEGSSVTVRWRGSAAEVLLLDPVNFSKYCRGTKLVFHGAGGHYGHSPARLSIPEDGRWYVVLDLGGYSGNARATVEVLNPADGQPQETHEETLVEVG